MSSRLPLVWPLHFQLIVTLGDGQDVGMDTLETINKLLEDVSSDLRLAG
jgi:hypothetical protein